ncbi:hypothetical protein AAL_01045 [Moelleriella libera RCEF 2490]|uniref:Uncharacterized protein n=1 Tax=Moelleriella libera RCEF 2490 TaxID=1081109 RepID=A0A166VES1_9HYPO|nr:hypothetical protein AAL_01045 [Moelleriella libera RCEF 2490]
MTTPRPSFTTTTTTTTTAAAVVSVSHYSSAWASRFQHLLDTSAAVPCLSRVYVLTSLALVTVACASQSLALCARIGVSHGLSMSAEAVASLWDARTTRQIRKKLFYEFAVFILGAGNVFFLLLLWPGWLVLGGLLYAVWRYAV